MLFACGCGCGKCLWVVGVVCGVYGVCVVCVHPFHTLFRCSRVCVSGFVNCFLLVGEVLGELSVN